MPASPFENMLTLLCLHRHLAVSITTPSLDEHAHLSLSFAENAFDVESEMRSALAEMIYPPTVQN